MERKVLKVWDTNNYIRLEEAERDGAVTEIAIPKNMNAQDQVNFFHGFKTALSMASERLCTDMTSLNYKIVEAVDTYTVNFRALEWNEYSVEVNATSSKEAIAYVLSRGGKSIDNCEFVENCVRALNKSETTDDSVISCEMSHERSGDAPVADRLSDN